MTGSSMFWYGVIGAAAPETLRVFNLRLHPNRFAWSAKYVLMSMGPSTPWAAIYIGISAPVLINTALKHSLAAPSERAVDKGNGSEVMSSEGTGWRKFFLGL